eukprot:COSAG01_NODE_7107_length_3351_cov_19.762608_2_plen_88_part_00
MDEDEAGEEGEAAAAPPHKLNRDKDAPLSPYALRALTEEGRSHQLLDIATAYPDVVGRGLTCAVVLPLPPSSVRRRAPAPAPAAARA